MQKGRLGGKREQTKVLNRAAILNAARKVFLKRGYDGTSVRDIIRQTGLAAGTFYNYYPDKESVFKAIIDHYLQSLSIKVRAERTRATNLEDFIRPAYGVFFSNIAEDPEAYELTRKNESVLTTMYKSSLMEIISATLRDDIKQAVETGIIPEVDSEMLTACFVGIAYELGQTMIRRHPANPEAMTEFATRLFLGGINALPTFDGAVAVTCDRHVH